MTKILSPAKRRPIYFIVLLIPLLLFAPAEISGKTPDSSRLKISTSFDSKAGLNISKGSFRVPENRDMKGGKQIHLKFLILHSRMENPATDPLFILVGGPGVAATMEAPWARNDPVLKERDIVLVALRGTGGDNRLYIDLGKSGIQGLMDSAFRLPLIKENRDRLMRKYDLTRYSNEQAVDDLEEFRKAMGYGKINLRGRSGGTRVALVYMKRHPGAIRSVILNGVVPYPFKNPLYHASASQEALEKLMKECRNYPSYRNIKSKFYEILDRLDKNPVRVTVKHPETGKKVDIMMNRNHFADAVRFLLYRSAASRKLPYLIGRAYEGHYRPFAELALGNYFGVNRVLSLGLLLCVSCTEDTARITEEEIIRETRDTFLGDTRVREQKAACDIWPKSKLSPDYAGPFHSDIPVLMLSGTRDPVTPARFAEDLVKYLPNALHLVTPGAHGVGNKCLRNIQMEFLRKGSAEGLDISCTKQIKLPPLYFPETR